MALKAVIFDIDGVLADSRGAVAHNTKCLMEEFGFVVDAAVVDRMSSAHSAESVLLALAPQLSRDRGLLRKMLARLAELTKENIALVKPTPLVQRLPQIAAKYKVAAATNRKKSAELVLERLGVMKHFSSVVTTREAPPKPKPDMVRVALARLGVEAREAVFFGDNEEDREAGETAGVRFVKADCSGEEGVETVLRELGIA
jgi:HAD superfamily hydrolase (TIGR01509 family)